MSDSDAAGRVRTLLLRADNMLKNGRPEKVRETLEQAREAAQDPSVQPAVRDLVQRRLDALTQTGLE